MALAAGLRPRVHWEFQLDNDWQPLTLAASAAVEARHVAWLAGAGPPLARERSGCGRLEYSVDFASMTQYGGGAGAERRAVRREELYEKGPVEALLEELRRERRARAQAEAAPGGGQCAAAAAAVAAAPSKEGASGRGAHASAAVAPKGELWRSLEALSDRLFALPSHAFAEKHCEVTPLPPVDPRRQWLEHYFLSSFEQHRQSFQDEELCPRADIQVMYVLEVYNPIAVQSYRHEVSMMRHKWKEDCPGVPELEGVVRTRTDLGGPRLNEVLLFHGTSWASSTAILNEGFDTRLFGQQAGAAFGAGTYFSPVASKADFYTRRLGDAACPQPGDPEQRVMIVGRVALGAVYEAAQYAHGLRRPPATSGGAALFDSVLGLPSSRGGVLDFPEFVVYKPGQAVPQFVVCYKHRPGCRCRTCVAPRP